MSAAAATSRRSSSVNAGLSKSSSTTCTPGPTLTGAARIDRRPRSKGRSSTSPAASGVKSLRITASCIDTTLAASERLNGTGGVSITSPPGV